MRVGSAERDEDRLSAQGTRAACLHCENLQREVAEGEARSADWVQVLDSQANRASERFRAAEGQTRFCLCCLAAGRFAHLNGANSRACLKSLGEEMTRDRKRPTVLGTEQRGQGSITGGSGWRSKDIGRFPRLSC